MTLKEINRRLAAMNDAAIQSLKAEWASICNAMADGYWHGTEAQALDRIEAIKAQIAELEKSA